MKNILRLLATAVTLMVAASAFAVPTVPGGAPTPIGDVAPIAWSATLGGFSYLQLDSSGNLMVTGGGGGGGGGTSSNFAAAFPTAGTAIGVKDSTGVNMTFLKVTAANALVTDTTTIAGTAVDVNTGNASAGTQRFVLATNQPNLTTPLNINQAQVGGNAESVNDGTTDNGTIRVTLGTIGSFTGSVAQSQAGLPVRPAPQITNLYNFSKVITNNVDTSFLTLVQTGGGQTVNQSSGNLVLTAGTTANSETIIRSTAFWNGSFNLRVGSNLSQRIANNNFYVELVDVVQDGATYSITNATTVVVTFTSNPFTSANVGQQMYLGVITGAAGIPMKATIASVSGSTTTYTVAGWPASGSGTLSVYGWNYHHLLFNGATATQAAWDAQRSGWATGDTTITINTTASPGTVAQITNDAGTTTVSDSLTASSTTPTFVTRGSRFQNIPGNGTNLYLQIRSTNGTSAPGSGTTWTVNYVAIEDFAPLPVAMGPAKLIGAGAPPIVIAGGTLPTVTSVGTVTTVTGVTTVTTLTTLANGQTAHSAASTGSPVRVGGRVVTSPDTTLATGDASDLLVTTAQQLVTKDYGTAENDWQASSGTTPLATTTSTALKAAGAASIRNYATAAQFYNTSATVSTTVSILDGASVIWTGYLPATTAALPVVPLHIVFPTPLRGTAATAMNIQLGTTAASVYYNVEGYQSF